MSLGKNIRLRRLFSHPSGRLCSVAVDHFIGYQVGLPSGLTDLPATLAKLVPALPGAITMNKGVALTCWAPHAGKVPLIIQSGCFTPDDSVLEIMCSADEALRLGADALALAIGVRGPQEGRYLKALADAASAGDRAGIPVIAHIYPRVYENGKATIVFTPEQIAWAVRSGIECGVDVIKVGYTGDMASFRQIVAGSPVPVVAAGGPKAPNFAAALTAMGEAVAAGARGATIGRNIWGAADPVAALTAFKAVILDGRSASEALRQPGLAATG
ncbi:MAG: aldolase [Planctomycetes bacterium]|nr:aldolase [Planctomycetota bacterium]